MRIDADSAAELRRLQTAPLPEGTAPLPDAEVERLLGLLDGWRRDGDRIVRELSFDDFDATMEFVNGVADVAREADHHPDMTVGYDRCTVAYSTHSVGGLSVNDFVSAARVDDLRR